MIGVFDSGVGGLTVLRDIHRILPQYGTHYLGDNARAPYGVRTHEEITEFAWQGVEWLFAQGCALVILACNSASAQALRTIQQERLHAYPGRRVLGVIRPTVEELAQRGYRHVGVLATPATVASQAYIHEFQKLDSDLEISQHACPAWVPIVEQGIGSTEQAKATIKKDVETFFAHAPKTEAVLLGCTHYPAIFSQIRACVPEQVDLFEQGPIVAKKLFDYLTRHPEIERALAQSRERRYATTGDPVLAARAASQISGLKVAFEKIDLQARSR